MPRKPVPKKDAAKRKADKDTYLDLNTNIKKWLKLLIKQLEFYVDVKTGKDKLIYSYKLKSIKNALRTVNKIGFEIKAGKDIESYEGIGKGTVSRINEILESGHLAEVKEADISGTHLEYVEELMKIFGIGRVKAYELYTVHNIKSIDDLKKAVLNNEIELPHAVKIGLKYVDRINTTIPRAEMDQMNYFLIGCGIEVDPEMDVRVCGSYRREAPTSGDIDVIITHPAIRTKLQAKDSNLMVRFVSHLIDKNFIIDSLTSIDAKTKYMGLCSIDTDTSSADTPVRRIDIRFMAIESYFTAILYFTGSGPFNEKMRMIGNSLGYTLNEYQLTRLADGVAMTVKSEKDVFDYLNMEYLQPADRY